MIDVKLQEKNTKTVVGLYKIIIEIKAIKININEINKILLFLKFCKNLLSSSLRELNSFGLSINPLFLPIF